MSDRFLFEYDEQEYLKRYEDISSAVKKGALPSGREHFLKFGRHEGRRAVKNFDEAWYLKTYPLVAADIEKGFAKSPFDHFVSIGRYRGYLGTPDGAREDNPAGIVSPYGGLWTDQGNAGDLIRGKLELGLIDEEQAEALDHWIKYGYVIFPSAIPEELLNEASEEFNKAFAVDQATFLFECQNVGPGVIPWHESLTESASKGLDFHWHSEAYRKLIFSSKIRQFLNLVFERPPMATQSLSFYLGSSQSAHQDWAYVTYTLPNQFLASWIALEDVVPPAGELFYYTGSQKLDEMRFGGRYKSPHEAKRINPDYSASEEAQRYVNELPGRCEALGMWHKTFVAKKGDVLIWAAHLVHGGSPVTKGRTRKSVVTHYCPREVAPLYFEARPRHIKTYDRNCYYTTAIY